MRERPRVLSANPRHRPRLQEDYDEPGWWRVVVEVALPESLPVDVWLDQNRRYYERLYARIPLAQTPLFVMSHEYRAE